MNESEVKVGSKTKVYLFWALVFLIVLLPLVYFGVKRGADARNVASSERFEKLFVELKSFDEMNYLSKVEAKEDLIGKLDMLIESYPSTVASQRALFYKGYVAYEAGDSENASVYLTKFLKDHSRNYLVPKANYYMSFVAEDLEKIEEAFSYLAVVIDDLKDSYYAPLALTRSADLALVNNDVDAAKKYYAKVIADYPLSSQAGIARTGIARLENGLKF